VVAATAKIPRKIMPDSKTDRLDALKLAEYLSKGMLQGVTVPSREEYALRELERRREQLVSSRRKLRQQIKSFLLKNSIRAPKGLGHWTQEALTELKGAELGNIHLRLALDSFLRELEFICSEACKAQETLTRELKCAGKDILLKNLRTIPGVGVTVSQTFVTEIFRPERFARAEEICAYVGLAPVTSQSGQSKARARLAHAGQSYLRSILIESAWILIRKDQQYRSVYNRLYSRTNLPQKAIVAVARKLLVILWRASFSGKWGIRVSRAVVKSARSLRSGKRGKARNLEVAVRQRFLYGAIPVSVPNWYYAQRGADKIMNKPDANIKKRCVGRSFFHTVRFCVKRGEIG
jgi:transposase